MPDHEGHVVPCFSASSKNWAARSQQTPPLNATRFVPQEAKRIENKKQRVVGRFAQRFSSFDQGRARSTPLWFPAQHALWMHEWIISAT